MRRLVFFSLTVCLVAFAPQAIYAQPATPGNFTVKSDDTLARLSWSGSAGASYNIQRSRTPGGPYALLINVGTTSYNDGAVTNGGACFYVVAAVSNAVAGANSPEAAAIPLGAGAYHIVNRLSGLALDDTNGASNVGLDQQPISGTNQLWTITPTNSGFFTIRNQNGDAVSGPTASAQLVVSPFTSASNQFWTFQVTNNSYYLLRNAGTSQLMDDFGNSTNAGTPVGQWVFTGGFNQNWTVSIPVLQLVSVVLTNGGLMPQGVFNGQINPNGLDTTVICQLGTNTSYGLSVTNFIAATNGPVSFSYTIPITTDRSIPQHGLLTASSATSVVTSGDLAVNSISFEVRLSTSGPTDCAALWDANEDGYLDLAITGSGPTGGPEQGLYKNPGATGNPWQLFYTPNELGRR